MKIRTHLSLMVVSILVPVAVFSGIALNTLLRAEREAAYQAMRETARSSMLAVDRELSRTQGALHALATSDNLDAEGLPAFYAQAKSLNTDPRSWTVLLNQEGQQLFNTSVPYGTPLPPPTQLERLRRFLDLKEPVSNLMTGPVTKRMVLALGVPVERDAGQKYILTQTFTADYFERTFTPLRDRPNWLIGLFDRDGRTIARSRPPTSGLIGNFPNPRLLAGIKTKRDDVFRNSSRDGVEVYTVLSRSPLSGWTIGVGVPVDEIETVARRAVMMSALGLLAAIFLAVGLAAFFGRQLVEAVRAAAGSAVALGRGEVPARLHCPIGELDDLHAAQVDAGLLLTRERDARREAEQDRERWLVREQKARQSAEAANQAKDQFLAMLGHEIRNPLAAIGGAVGVLRRGTASQPQVSQALAIFDRQSAHLTHIVDDLLDVARVTTGKVALEQKPLDLAEVVRHCIDSMQTAGHFSSHRTSITLAPAAVAGDATRLEQIINNLVGNALKYTPSGGTIKIDVRREGAAAVLTVQDSGIGIAAELMPHVFDLFTQGPTPIDRAQGGLGIGLTLVKRLVEMHGGSVIAASSGPGQGARFEVRLPAIEIMAVALPPPVRPAEAGHHRVLLVEDSEDGREMMSMMLQMDGHTVFEAADGETAIELARRHLPDIAVLDIGLPGMSGLELASQLRADPRIRHMGLIALTGYGLESDRQDALAAGFDLHLIKPVNMGALSKALSDLAAAQRLD